MTFSAVPPVPQLDNPEWLYRFNSAIKQNVELLTGQRGSSGFNALLSGQVTASFVPELQMKQVTAKGTGIAVNSTAATPVVLQSDYVNLIVNVQTLANDVAVIRSTLNSLLAQLGDR